VRRWAWLSLAAVAVLVGVVLDSRVSWFPAFFVGLLLGIAVERFDGQRKRRAGTDGTKDPSPARPA